MPKKSITIKIDLDVLNDTRTMADVTSRSLSGYIEYACKQQILRDRETEPGAQSDDQAEAE